jgi:hypothetical protein
VNIQEGMKDGIEEGTKDGTKRIRESTIGTMNIWESIVGTTIIQVTIDTMSIQFTLGTMIMESILAKGEKPLTFLDFIGEGIKGIALPSSFEKFLPNL